MSRLHVLQSRIAQTASRLGSDLQDPSNVFHGLRGELLRLCVATRVFSCGKMKDPLTHSEGDPVDAIQEYTVDNSFFFELRKTFKPDAHTDVNVVVFIGRVFFPETQDATRFRVQMVANHMHDGILDLNVIYNAASPQFLDWKYHNNKKCIPYYEKTYDDYNQFVAFVKSLLETTKPLNVTAGICPTLSS